MTDGQSESQQYIDTSHPALRQTAKERIDQHRERYEQLKKNARYGVPPWTVDDYRFVLWLLDGERVEQRKRCEVCNSTGRVQERINSVRNNIVRVAIETELCRWCNGKGYVQTSE